MMWVQCKKIKDQRIQKKKERLGDEN